MKTNKLKIALLAALVWSTSTFVEAQSKLYPRLFDLQEVSVDNGMCKYAMELNDSVL